MELEKILPLVSRPARYIDREWNSAAVPQDLGKRLRICFCFPDLYEVGASNLGIEILYHTVNSRVDAYAERVYAPDKDYAYQLEKNKIPLFSLETRTPLRDFDLIGFSLQYELCYTNVLTILNLAGIPLRQGEREDTFPLILAGGPCITANPEPMSEFFDFFVLGEGEEIISEIIETVKRWKNETNRKDKKDLLLNLAKISGIYVPSFYKVEYKPDRKIDKIVSNEKVNGKIVRRIVNLDEAFYPHRPVVPYLETVHNRLNIEIMRGCPWGCRFCQAGYIYRPYRERSLEKVLSFIDISLAVTGYDEISLSGLSATDYSKIFDLINVLLQRYEGKHLRLSLPSLRCDHFSLELVKLIEKFPQSTLTFAPEAGSERLRFVLRKKIMEEQILSTISYAYNSGWRKIKLYFMYGLPTEEKEDLEEIIRLAREVIKKYPGLHLTFTLSPFVPKAQTPFQWLRQEPMDILREKKDYLSRHLPGKIRMHRLETSLLESIFARGDRRLSAVILKSWEKGCSFDEWTERLRFDLWMEAFADCGIDPEFYFREREENEILPWEHLNCGIDKNHLRKEYEATFSHREIEEMPEQEGLGSSSVVYEKVQFLGRFSAPTVEKARLRFSREGDLRYLSHLEEITLFRRIFRRADLPLAYTQGFQPQMKISFGPAISVGYASQSEYVDIELVRRLNTEEIRKMVTAQLPKEISLLEIKRIPTFFPSLESTLNVAEYHIGLPNNLKEVDKKIEQFFSQEKVEIVKQRKKEIIDVRPLVRELKFMDNKIKLFLRFLPKKNIKPELVIQKIFDLSLEETICLDIERVQLWQEDFGGILSLP